MYLDKVATKRLLVCQRASSPIGQPCFKVNGTREKRALHLIGGESVHLVPNLVVTPEGLRPKRWLVMVARPMVGRRVVGQVEEQHVQLRPKK